MPNGDIIDTCWENGARHGKGFITKKKNGQRVEVLYYKDMKVKVSDQNPDCYDKMPLNLVFIGIFFTFLFLSMTSYDPIGWYIGAGIFYIIILIESACSKTKGYLSH